MIVEVLVVAAMFALVFAATDTSEEAPFMLLVAGVLVGAGLMLEPKVTAPRVADIGPQVLQPPPELEPTQFKTHTGHFGGAMADAAVA